MTQSRREFALNSLRSHKANTFVADVLVALMGARLRTSMNDPMYLSVESFQQLEVKDRPSSREFEFKIVACRVQGPWESRRWARAETAGVLWHLCQILGLKEQDMGDYYEASIDLEGMQAVATWSPVANKPDHFHLRLTYLAD